VPVHVRFRVGIAALRESSFRFLLSTEFLPSGSALDLLLNKGLALMHDMEYVRPAQARDGRRFGNIMTVVP
jgi:hypothetical protein